MVTPLVAFVVGLLFAVGLGLGGMTQPRRILAFLDVGGAWDPSLLLVMGGAVTVYAIAWRVARRRPRPVLARRFAVPADRALDGRLVGGALLFGVGWGIAGICPGPAVTALASGETAALVFVAAMLAGMGAHRMTLRRPAAD